MVAQRENDITVAIIGGGIGGLSCAYGLLKKGIDVHVYESAPKFAEIGAGISIGRNAQNAYKELGLYDDFLKIADTTESGLYFQFRGAADNEIYAEAYHEPLGQCSVHRAVLLDTLVKDIPTERSHFGKRLVNIVQSDSLSNGDAHAAAHGANGQTKRSKPVQLHFEDGTQAEADVVIGYDGIHSTTRKFLDAKRSGLEGGKTESESSRLVWSGTWAYRAMIPREQVCAALGEKEGDFYVETSQMWFGPDTHIIMFPIKDASILNVVAFITDRSKWPERSRLPEGEAWVQKADKEEMLRVFKQKKYHDIPLKILNLFEDPSRWALHQIVPSLKSYVNGRVLVAGDAAHGGVPHLGAMAGQAIEDGLFLTRLFSHPQVNASNIEKILHLHDTLRLPRANAVLEASLHQGEIYEFYGANGDDMRKVGPEARDTWKFVVEHDFEKERRRVEEEVERVLKG